MLHLKTDDELRFFVEHPAYYQPELVVAARQELRRRFPAAPASADVAKTVLAPGPAIVTEAALADTLSHQATYPTKAPIERTDTESNYANAPPHQKAPWLPLASAAMVLLLAGLGFWGKANRHQPAAASQPRATTAASPPSTTQATAASPPPATAATSPPQPTTTPSLATLLPLDTAALAPPLPTSGAERYVKEALDRVPTAEKANEQQLAQYQIISRLFWTAQQPSAHLLAQVQRGENNPAFGDQAALVRSLWRDFDRTLVYSYHFGPGMSDHLERMKTVARYQSTALTELAGQAAANQPLRITDSQVVASLLDVPKLLAPLQAKQSAPAHY